MTKGGFLSGLRGRGAVARIEVPVAVPAEPDITPPRLFVAPAEGAVICMTVSSDAPLHDHPTEIVAPGGRIDGAPVINCLGDELVSRMLPGLAAALHGYGLSPNFVGTVQHATGLLSEARPGKMAGQFALAFPGMTPVQTGGEDAYLEAGAAARVSRNPYATLDGSGQPVIDVAGYFRRFDIAVPDYVVIALGGNDVRTRPRSAIGFVETLLETMIPQFLALSPSLRIGLLQSHFDADEDARTIQRRIVRACLDAAEQDDRIDVIPVYALVPSGGDHAFSADAPAAATAAWVAWCEAQATGSDRTEQQPLPPPITSPGVPTSRSALSRPASQEDVRALYTMILGRAPESDAATAQSAGMPVGELASALLTSEELRRRLPGEAAERARKAYPGEGISVAASAAQLDALIERTRETWTDLGAKEPFWSVLTNDAFRTQAMDRQAQASFFDSGRQEVADFTAACARNDIALPFGGTILDLGCGVGRVGLHLSDLFEHYIGVDLSEPHLEVARTHFAQASVKGASFMTLDELVERPPSYDCFYSLITLQHSPPPIVCALLDLLMGGLSRGGVGYFQMPYALYDYGYAVDRHLAQPNAVGEMEIHAVPQRDIFAVARHADCDMIEALPDGKIGASGLSATYLVRKR